MSETKLTNGVQEEAGGHTWRFTAAIAFLILGVVCIGGGVWVAYDDYQKASPTTAPVRGWSELGQRGDFWGGHFSAAAGIVSAFFLAATLFLQMEEMHGSATTTKAHTQALGRQAEAIEKQNELVSKQSDLREQRNDIDFILHIAGLDSLNDPDANTQILRHAMGHITRVALRAPERALDLLELLCLLARPQCFAGPLSKAVDSACSGASCEPLYQPYKSLQGATWVEVARGLPDGKYAHWGDVATVLKLQRELQKSLDRDDDENIFLTDSEDL